MPNSLMIEAARDLSRNPSTRLWADCNWNDIREGRVPGKKGFADHFEFSQLKMSANINAADAYWSHGYNVFGSDGGSIAVFDGQGGGATFGADGDNEGVAVREPGAPFEFDRDLLGFWFECRLRTSTVADTKHGWVLGLRTNTAASATVPIAAAGTLADENYILFHRLEGDGDQVDVVIKADGQTAVAVDTDILDGGTYGGGVTPSALAADTWIKFGIKYTQRGHRRGDYRMSFWVNGIELPGGYNITSTQGNPFPNDVRLGRHFSLLNATATTPGTTTLQWWRAAQLFA